MIRRRIMEEIVDEPVVERHVVEHELEEERSPVVIIEDDEDEI